MRILLLVLVFAGCIINAQSAMGPAPSGNGTLTCRQIAEQCDANCTNPMCLRACGSQGNVDAATQHNAVVDCGQRNGCFDEACMRSACGAEMDACQGPADPNAQPTAEEPPPLAPVVQ